MQLKSVFGILSIALILSSCGNDYEFSLNSPKRLKINEPLQLSVHEKNDMPIDSVRYYLNGNQITTNESLSSTQRLGRNAVSATVFYEDKQKQLTNTIYLFAAKKPAIYAYEVINEYPHDKEAFTQGLEFHNGFLYESTGQFGQSSIRKVALETGEVLQRADLDKEYFGEGMTIFNDEIVLLTWQKMMGFVYNLETFEKIKEFSYNQSKQGWGLTHNDTHLIKSDGTERIWFLNSKTQKEERFIEAYTNDRKADALNELEYINGKIYSNKWQMNSILIIDPVSGAIEGIANLKGLQAKANQTGTDNVLNGIAYDALQDRLFVTGKKWDKVFEIKLRKK